MTDLTTIELIALGLWYAVLAILCIAFVCSIIFYKKSKSKYAVGLIFLCIGFLVGRLFRIWVSFYTGEPSIASYSYEALIAINIAFWSVIFSMFLLAAISLQSDKIKGKIFIAYWICLIVVALVIAYVSASIIKSNIGKVPVMVPYTGTALLFENIYLIASWLGFIALFLNIEIATKDLFTVKKQKFLFTGITIVALVFTVIENYTASVTYALIILFIASMGGMAAIFLYMAINSAGSVRRNSLMVCVGHLLIAFSFALDIQTGYTLFAILPSVLLLISAPILQIIGLILYVGGLFPIIFKKK